MKLPRQIAFGIRPEQVIVAPGPRGDAPIAADILWVEHLGNRSIVTLRVGDTKLAAVVPPDHRLSADRRAWIGIKPEPQHLLDRKTGVFFSTGVLIRISRGKKVMTRQQRRQRAFAGQIRIFRFLGRPRPSAAAELGRGCGDDA